MPLQRFGEIYYFSFENLSREGVTNAIFTRRGGVSPPPWQSLNLNWFNGDQYDRVLENHRRAFRAVGRELSSLCDARQVHGAEVHVFEQPPLDFQLQKKPEADALLTDNTLVTLMMRFADCVPILLYDPRHHVVGVVHSGWKGTVKRVAAAAITRMRSRFDTNPSEILAGIGPSICVDHYEVRDEVITSILGTFGKGTACLVNKNGHTMLDLWAANLQILEDAGVRNVEVAEICTADNIENWYSYRGENQKTGGFAALIGLN